MVFWAFLIIPALSQPHGTATVVRVIDGDTLKVEFQGQKESIRLIGIDTPESRANPKAKRDAQRSGEDIKRIIAMGGKATAFTKSKIKKGGYGQGRI